MCLCLASIVSARMRSNDPEHYTVVTENDQVTDLKVHYGPHEKSIMHSHPATVAVFLTDAKGQFSYPDGKKGSLCCQGRRFAIRSSHHPPARKHQRCGNGCNRRRTERPRGKALEGDAPTFEQAVRAQLSHCNVMSCRPREPQGQAGLLRFVTHDLAVPNGCAPNAPSGL